MSFHHLNNAQFPYKNRFHEDDTIFIPEIGKNVCRKTYPYVCEAYAYYIEEDGREQEIYCESKRHYAFWARNNNSLIPLFPQMYLYNDEDGIYYFHIFWERKHYAVILRKDVSADSEKTLLTGKHDACCYISGIEVDSFEGMDAWKKEYEQFISKSHLGIV